MLQGFVKVQQSLVKLLQSGIDLLQLKQAWYIVIFRNTVAREDRAEVVKEDPWSKNLSAKEHCKVAKAQISNIPLASLPMAGRPAYRQASLRLRGETN